MMGRRFAFAWVVVAACGNGNQQPPPLDDATDDAHVAADGATSTGDGATSAGDGTGTSSGDTGVPDQPEPDGTINGVVQGPGRVVWHRLNRTEYRNTVRDLLGAHLDPGADLPADDLGYGFDDIAKVLTLSPLHLELYERAARLLAAEVTREPITETQRHVIEGEDAVGDEATGAVIGDRYILFSSGQISGEVTLPRAGAWRFEVRAWEDHAGDEPANLVAWVDGAVVASYALTPEATTYTVDLELEAGHHGLAVEFTNDFYEDPNDRNAWVDWFALSGPGALDVYADTAWGKTVKCTPAALDAVCARDTISDLARRAWRRPPESAQIDGLMALYDDAIAEETPRAEALALPIEAILLSSRFLFRVEDTDPAATAPVALDGWAIASRLAYFIWSTMPDELLFTAAREGRLNDVAGIRTEVARMLADPRAEALVQNFAGQWLYVRDIANVFPDPNRFPEFDEGLRAAMSEEMQRFFRSFLRGDRSLLELVTAKSTWVNKRLAEHYGLEANVPANDATWAEVPLGDVPRQGLLGQAGLMTVLSTPFRTSIVRRGKWVLAQLLCAEPASPPPDIPSISETPPGGTPHTLREKMEMHKTEERCVVCHKSMDAIGFALERYDGIGAWRTTDEGFPIDATGSFKGEDFDGALELADLIVKDPRLPACMATKLATYALGRGIGAEDEALLQSVGAQFASGEYRLADLVTAIATSDAFRMREGER